MLTIFSSVPPHLMERKAHAWVSPRGFFDPKPHEKRMLWLAVMFSMVHEKFRLAQTILHFFALDYQYTGNIPLNFTQTPNLGRLVHSTERVRGVHKCQVVSLLISTSIILYQLNNQHLH
jgi:hypothetical protein